MRKLILAAVAIALFTACNKDENENSAPVYVTPQGTADITLMTNDAHELKLNGPCGWVYAGGVGYIGANQSDDPLKTFAVETNLTALPAATTTYTITDDALNEDPTKITVHLTKFNSGSNYTSFDGYAGSGTLTLVVNGNKVTADLSGIDLAADDANLAPYTHDGTLSGTLTFYK